MSDSDELHEIVNYIFDVAMDMKHLAIARGLLEGNIRAAFALGFLNISLELGITPQQTNEFLQSLSQKYESLFEKSQKVLKNKQECGTYQGKKKAEKKPRKTKEEVCTKK